MEILQKHTPLESALIIAGWLAFIGLWILVLSHYGNLPETIPTHFNAKGEADDYGPKATIFLLPAICTLIFIGMPLMLRFPTQMNHYSGKVTPEQATDHYAWAGRIVNYYNFAIPLVFGILIYETIQVAHGKTTGLGVWSLVITLILILIPIPMVLKRVFKAS